DTLLLKLRRTDLDDMLSESSNLLLCSLISWHDKPEPETTREKNYTGKAPKTQGERSHGAGPPKFSHYSPFHQSFWSAKIQARPIPKAAATVETAAPRIRCLAPPRAITAKAVAPPQVNPTAQTSDTTRRARERVVIGVPPLNRAQVVLLVKQETLDVLGQRSFPLLSRRACRAGRTVVRHR